MVVSRNFICLLSVILLVGCGWDLEEFLLPNSQPLPSEIGTDGNFVFLELKDGEFHRIDTGIERDFLDFLKSAKRTQTDGTVGSTLKFHVGKEESNTMPNFELELSRPILWGDGRQYSMREYGGLYSSLCKLASDNSARVYRR